MTTLSAAVALVDLPDEAVAEFGLTLVSFLDEHGDESWALATHGDGNTSKLIGLLSMVTHELLHAANPTPCEEEL